MYERSVDFSKSPVTGSEIIERCTHILKLKFKYGFHPNSILDLRKFKHSYVELYSVNFVDDSEVLNILRGICFNYLGIYYLPELLIPSEVRDEILKYIETLFKQGKEVINLQALYNEFSDKLVCSQIKSSEMLGAYLENQFQGKYYFTETCILRDGMSQGDILEAVKDFMKLQPLPVQAAEVCSSLPNYSAKEIKNILNQNPEFIMNSVGEFIDVCSIDISPSELDKLSILLDSLIKDREYVSGTEFFDILLKKFPKLIERNNLISSLGWRNYLKYNFGSKYSFNGNIISSFGKKLDIWDIFNKFSQSYETFDLTTLSKFAENIGAPIEFEAIFENSIRVSKKDFVSRSKISFEIDKIDAVLDKYCKGHYFALSEVTDYSLFPECGYPWNSFLLEQYVYNYSLKYKLLHRSFTTKTSVGVIVSRKYPIDNYDDLIVDLLAKSDITLEKDTVLDYLAEKALISRRKYDTIESILLNAKARRRTT